MKKLKVFENKVSTASIMKAMEDNTKLAGYVESKLSEKYGSEYKEKYGSDDFADIFLYIEKNEKSGYNSWISKQLKRFETEYPEIFDEICSKIN